jgi:hypothetical protein
MNSSRARSALLFSVLLGCVQGPAAEGDAGTSIADAAHVDAPATDRDAAAPPPGCPALDGSSPNHVVLGRASSGPAVIDADTTWTAENTYFVIGSVDVMGATLTIEAGTQVCLDAGTMTPPSIDFRPAGASGAARLVVRGTVDAPVVFQPATADSAWNAINFSHDSSASLAHLVLLGGGSGGAGVLRVPDGFAEPLDATGLRIDGARGMGMSLRSEAGLAAGATIRIDSLAASSFESPAIEVSLLGAATLTPSNLVIGAAVPAELRWILLTDNVVDRSLTLRGDLGVPFVVTGDLDIARDTPSDSIPTLTLEAGAELRFEAGRLRVGSSSGIDSDGGNLVANGTPSSPVRFASRTTSPAAGDWVGIEIHPNSIEPGGTILRNVVVADAGQDLGNGILYCELAATPLQAAIRLRYTGGEPSYEGPTLEGVRIERSLGDGLAFTCSATTCLSTDYADALTGTDVAGELLRDRSCS